VPAPRTRSPLAGRTPRLSLLHIASEVAPWSKTGGLADVVSALPAALEALGHQVTTVTPLYGSVGVPAGAQAHPFTMEMAGTRHTGTWQVVTHSPRRRTVFVDLPAWFGRDGLYGVAGQDHPDNAERFAGLAHAALSWAQDGPSAARIDIVHCHDWQAGVVPALLRTQPERWPKVARAGLVCTIHNLAYQGNFPKDLVPRVGLEWQAFTMETGEFWGQLSYLKLGIAYSDVITTVSPTYALETVLPAEGFGFDGVLRARVTDYVGILNGIDTSAWNPASDTYLPAHYTADDLAGKRLCKRALLERLGLPVGDDVLSRPLVGLVSRLVDQKGIDLVMAAAPELLALDATWVFVGSGDARYESRLKELAAAYPSRVATFIGFDEGLAHLVEAGADLFLMPSRFEPCGLNQMYSLRYGTVPVVRAVGGLEDTVQHFSPRAKKANGFKFKDATAEALVTTVRQALRVFRQPDVWTALMRRGMAEDHSWDSSAREYVKVYRRARHAAAVRWGEI
jgi:starch synthase